MLGVPRGRTMDGSSDRPDRELPIRVYVMLAVRDTALLRHCPYYASLVGASTDGLLQVA